MSDKEKFEVDRSGDPMSYSSGVPPDWRFGSGNLVSSSVGLVAMGNSSCSASMLDSFGPNFWDHHHHNSNSQNMGFSDINVNNNGSSSNTTAMGFLPNGQGVFPQSLSQFPTDSGFIERAARFSCFSGGGFGDVVHSYGVPQSMSLYAGTSGTIHGTRDSLVGHGLKSVTEGQSQESDLNVVEASKTLSPTIEHLATKGSDSRVMSQDEGKSALLRPVNDCERAESSDGGHGQNGSPMLDGTSGEPSNKGLNSKKRKRSGPDSDNRKANGTPEARSEDAKENSESQQKGDQQLTPANKASGKNAKQGSPASDPPKEEYIHVRARRGQATNSHSLAERVRREKISERMKFLQELVPGCSKVTGKAVMLDEIINYVQSLQRQVEFLSMKLATVNPRLDFNIEGLLAKDILHQRPGPSSGLGFPLEMSMNFPPLHPSQQPGLIQSVIPNMPNSSDILRRAIHPQLTHLSAGFKEPNQMPDVWEDELHNVVQMSFATTAPMSSQDVDGSAAASQMKVEL